MSWLARLKKTGIAPGMAPTKPTEPGFVGFVAPDMAPVQKTKAALSAANDSSPDLERWCWPHSSAMSGAEIDTFTMRQALFNDKGISPDEAEVLAYKLVLRDRDMDDRRLCLECSHIQGHRIGAWRCVDWQRAGISHRANDAQLSAALVLQLQRCGGFRSTQGADHGRT